MADTESPTNGNGQNSGGSVPEITVPAKRGRGRPPGSGSKSAAPGISAPKIPSTPRAPVAPDPDKLAEAKFIGTGFVSLVELAESFVHNNCAKRIEKRRPEKLGEFREIAEKLGLQPKEKDLIESSVAKIAEKYDWMTAHAPEFVLVVVMGQYALRQGSLIKFVNSTTKEEAKAEGSKNTGTQAQAETAKTE